MASRRNRGENTDVGKHSVAWERLVTLQHERRASERKTLGQLIYIQLPSGNGGIVLNVSEGGAAFQAVGPVNTRGPISFWLSAIVANSTRIEGTGELAWTDETQKT